MIHRATLPMMMLTLALSLGVIYIYGDPTITHSISQSWPLDKAPVPSPAHVYLLTPWTKADPQPNDKAYCVVNPILCGGDIKESK